MNATSEMPSCSKRKVLRQLTERRQTQISFGFTCDIDDNSSDDSLLMFMNRRKFIDNHDEKKFNQWNWYRFEQGTRIISTFMDFSNFFLPAISATTMDTNRYCEINVIRFSRICRFVNRKLKLCFRRRGNSDLISEVLSTGSLRSGEKVSATDLKLVS